MSNEQSEPQSTPNGGRRQLTIILVVALVSLGGSYLLFYFASSGTGWGTTNNGAFVDPPTTLSQVGWPDGVSRNWRLWVVEDEACTAECATMVTDLRALHILLSDKAGRVRRAITTRGADSTEVALPEPFPKLERMNPTNANELQRGVYIVDPNGNLVFRYEMAVNPKFILEDLKKLLKLSQIG